MTRFLVWFLFFRMKIGIRLVFNPVIGLVWSVSK